MKRKVPSPTGDQRRTISLWLDEKRVPTLQFGGWHTHADLWDRNPDVGLRRMLDYLERITDGEIVLADSPTIGDGMPYRVIDLTDREELLDELTSPDVPTQMKLLSWSGAEDAVWMLCAMGSNSRFSAGLAHKPGESMTMVERLGGCMSSEASRRRRYAPLLLLEKTRQKCPTAMNEAPKIALSFSRAHTPNAHDEQASDRGRRGDGDDDPSGHGCSNAAS